jgi:hypothetical protein
MTYTVPRNMRKKDRTFRHVILVRNGGGPLGPAIGIPILAAEQVGRERKDHFLRKAESVKNPGGNLGP